MLGDIERNPQPAGLIRLKGQGFCLKNHAPHYVASSRAGNMWLSLSRWRARVSFQLSILRILAWQPDGRASIEVVNQHLAIYYSSGPEWPARMTRIASRAPELDIFGQRLIGREPGRWIITEDGRKVLETLEQLDRLAQSQVELEMAPPSEGERPPSITVQPRTVARRNRPRRKRLRPRKGRLAQT